MLWIREAGIGLNWKSKSADLTFGIPDEICAIFPQADKENWESQLVQALKRLDARS
jgi:hypothetical protein